MYKQALYNKDTGRGLLCMHKLLKKPQQDPKFLSLANSKRTGGSTVGLWLEPTGFALMPLSEYILVHMPGSPALAYAPGTGPETRIPGENV
jgi:hypothetical protein